MANIKDKPFNWAHRISRALFRGSPNLLTAPDLNRQIELLKQEMYLLQKGGQAVSDFTVTLGTQVLYPYNVILSGSVLYSQGIKFKLSTYNAAQTLSLSSINSAVVGTYRVDVFGKKKLVTASTDPTREISGAVFDDATFFPAADHYIFDEIAEVRIVNATAVSDIRYPVPSDLSGYEYLTTLAYIDVHEKYASGTFSNMHRLKSVQMTCQPLNGYNYPQVIGKVPDYSYDNLWRINSGDSLETVIKQLYDRIYSLEHRLFNEARANMRDLTNRTYEFPIRDNEAFGTANVGIGFRVVGGFCYLEGVFNCEKNTHGPDTPIRFNGTAYGVKIPDLPTMGGYGRETLLVSRNSKGNGDVKVVSQAPDIIFYGVPSDGCTVTFSGIYSITPNFWKPMTTTITQDW